MKYLILVTHPHRKHLVDNIVEKRFKGEVGTLVNQIVTESIYKDRIRHIDFLKSKNKFLRDVVVYLLPLYYLTINRKMRK